MPQLFFRPKYVWFPIHLKGPMIPDPSGQLAELIVYITSTRVDLYSHQILFLSIFSLNKTDILSHNEQDFPGIYIFPRIWCNLYVTGISLKRWIWRLNPNSSYLS